MSAHDVQPPIPLAHPDIGPAEEGEVLEVLRSGRLALGPKADEFERLVARFTGSAWAVATSSGTAALHLAVRALGIGPEDCVVTTSFSFIASSNCVRYEGAEPVFVDIDRETLCLSPGALRAYLDTCKDQDGSLRDPVTGRRVAAVLPVDVFGHPAHPGILEAAGAWDLPVIADTCEALGSRYRRQDGTWAHAGAGAAVAALAFYPNKQITTGEGGMAVTDDPALADVMRSLRNQGRDTDGTWLRHVRLGYNYRLDELSAAVGVAQIERIGELRAGRSRVAAAYERGLRGRDWVRLPKAGPGESVDWFVYVVRLAPGIDRDLLIGRLKDLGVPSRPYFSPLHLQPFYRARFGFKPGDFPVTERVAASTLALPFSSRLTDEDVGHVCEALIEAASAA